MGRRKCLLADRRPAGRVGKSVGSGLRDVSSIVLWVWEAGVPEREGVQSPLVLWGWWSLGELGSWQACSSSVHWL